MQKPERLQKAEAGDQKEKMSKKKLLLIICAILSLIILSYAGLLFVDKKGAAAGDGKSADEGKPAVEYSYLSLDADGGKHEIDILKINISSGNALVKPILSFDSTFGFEYLSKIVKRSGAYAAINAGFFGEYGEPSGLVVIDGKIASSASGNYPAFVISDGKAYFKTFGTTVKINISHPVANCAESLSCAVNRTDTDAQAIIFNRYFGMSNRVKTANITFTVTGNRISKINRSKGAVNIPKKGYLVTFFGADGMKIAKRLNLNDVVFWQTSDQTGAANDSVNAVDSIGVDQAYECGPFIVKNGRNVCPEKDRWVMTLANPDPRTAIGILKDGRVALITCDGRQKNLIGYSGKAFADMLINLGIKDAALLDGGASTEMMVNGKIVNIPSGDGSERPLGGGLAVILK